MLKPYKPQQNDQIRWEKHIFCLNYWFSSFSHLQSIPIDSGELLSEKPSKPQQSDQNRWEKKIFFSNYFFSSFSHLQSIPINKGELLNDKTN